MGRIVFYVALVFSLLSCHSTPTSPERNPAGTYWTTSSPNIQNYPIYWPDILDAKPEWTMSDLLLLIRNNRVKSVEELVPLLPVSYLQNYTLVYDSRSIQKSTPKDPRVIMYGRDAQLIMTYNGDKNLPGFNALEVMEFNRQKREFALYEIKLDGKNVPLDLPIKNPDKCAACHYSDPKPIWSSYPKWPGVFQSFEGTILGGVWRQYLKSSRNGFDEDDLQMIEKEASLYNDVYLRHKDSSSRYKPLFVHSETKPSRVLGDYVKYVDLNEEESGAFDRLTPRPNTDLGFFLSEMNMLRVMRKIEWYPRSRAYSYALLAATVCFNYFDTDNNNEPRTRFKIDKFFPPNFKFKKSLSSVFVETRNQFNLSRYYNHEAERKWLGGKDEAPKIEALDREKEKDATTVASLKFVLENMGIDTSDFGIEFHQSFEFLDGLADWSRLQRNLWRFALYPKEMNPDIFNDFNDNFDYDKYRILKKERIQPVCRRLQELSVRAIERGYR